MPNPHIHAALITSSRRDHASIPARALGVPDGAPSHIVENALNVARSAGKIDGTPMEVVCEIAGRTCYDSLSGTGGRKSPEYWKHILEVNHLSVIEHGRFTAVIPLQGFFWSSPRDLSRVLTALSNRPGVFYNQRGSSRDVYVTLNLRAVVEWDLWTRRKTENFHDYVSPAVEGWIGEELRTVAHRLAPNIVPDAPRVHHLTGRRVGIAPVPPVAPQEAYATLFLACSRGCSMEWLRHRAGGISQRSTRFVNEDESEWVMHPLETAWGLGVGAHLRNGRYELAESGIEHMRTVYHDMTERLERWLLSRGVDKFTARKQARGAARGYLGNGLYTEFVYTASIAEWKHIFAMRGVQAADAEIRELSVKAYRVLAEEFPSAFTAPVVDAPDGIGQVIG